MIGNSRSALNDSIEAKKLSPTYIKAYIRGIMYLNFYFKYLLPIVTIFSITFKALSIKYYYLLNAAVTNTDL